MAPIEAVDVVVMRLLLVVVFPQQTISLMIWRQRWWWWWTHCGHRIVEWGQPVLTDAGDLFVDDLVDLTRAADTTVVRVRVVVLDRC